MGKYEVLYKTVKGWDKVIIPSYNEFIARTMFNAVYKPGIQLRDGKVEIIKIEKL